MKAQKNEGERGAVLLTTLLMLTIMAAITVAIMDDILFSVRRTVNIEAAEQLDWYERGGEEFAKSWLLASRDKQQIKINQAITNNTPIILPIDDNNEFRLLITDGRNCFNVNQFANDTRTKNTRRLLTHLLQDIDFDLFAARSLSAHIADWIDANTIPYTNGAEGFTYLNMTPPYHAANRPMVDITELRAIESVDEDTFVRLAPLLCAANDDKENTLNLNSLKIEQAPLLASVFGVEGGLKIARDIISSRPDNGYQNIDTIWQREDILSLKIKGAGKDKVKLTTDRIIVNFQVRYHGQIRTKSALYAIEDNGDVKLLTRRSRF